MQDPVHAAGEIFNRRHCDKTSLSETSVSRPAMFDVSRYVGHVIRAARAHATRRRTLGSRLFPASRHRQRSATFGLHRSPGNGSCRLSLLIVSQTTAEFQLHGRAPRQTAPPPGRFTERTSSDDVMEDMHGALQGSLSLVVLSSPQVRYRITIARSSLL